MNGTRRFVAVVALLISAAVITGAGQAPARPTATPAAGQFGNADVIKLVQSGLSDGFVVARIRQAPVTNFDLSADALVLLKKAGVSETVLAVMLDPASTPPPPPASSPAASPPVTAAPAAATVAREPGIYLGDIGTAQIPLEPTVFSQGKSGGGLASAFTYGLVKAKWKAVIRNSRANIRTKVQQPIFIFQFAQKSSDFLGGFAGFLASATSPNEFVLAQMTRRRNDRELIVGEFGTLGSSTGTRSEDTVPFTVERLASGLYRVVPEEELGNGEYCFFYAAGAGALGAGAVGKLFDFGVDEE